jgi:hypothetical protein
MATLEEITARLELAERAMLIQAREEITPALLPGDVGAMARSVEKVLTSIRERAVVCGSWAVWWHGYYARCCSFDLVVVLDRQAVAPFVTGCKQCGFEMIDGCDSHWAKLRWYDSRCELHVVPEGSVGGNLYVRSPSLIAATRDRLSFPTFAGLILLKLTAGRAIDEADVIELIRANWTKVPKMDEYFSEYNIHGIYKLKFNALVAKAYQQEDR